MTIPRWPLTTKPWSRNWRSFRRTQADNDHKKIDYGQATRILQQLRNPGHYVYVDKTSSTLYGFVEPLRALYPYSDQRLSFTQLAIMAPPLRKAIMSSIEPFDPKLQFLTVDEVASALRVSSMTIYRLIKDDTIESVRFGRSIRISTVAYFSYIGRLEAAAKIRVAR